MADYGSLAGVGALVPVHSGNEHNFDTTTTPTSTEVTTFLDQISGMINSILAEFGFATPITTPSDVKNTLDGFVNQEVAAIIMGIKGSGRFGPSSKSLQSRGFVGMLHDDVREFIEGNKTGFELLGASRSRATAEAIGYRSTDEGGDETFPITQRKGFGNRFTNWDS